MQLFHGSYESRQRGNKPKCIVGESFVLTNK